MQMLYQMLLTFIFLSMYANRNHLVKWGKIIRMKKRNAYSLQVVG